MPKFHFKLDPLLRHREQLELQKQHEFARVQARFIELKSQLDFAATGTRHAAAQLVRNPAALPDHLRFIAALTAKSVTLRRELAACEKDRIAAHAAFAEAVTLRKVVETLREKQLAQWRKDQMTNEQKALDEVASLRAQAADGST